jgi:signal transduction histidine kinase
VTGDGPNFLAYDRGKVSAYTPDLRSYELVLRVKWFIQMRWFAVGACCMGAAAALSNIVPAQLNPVHFAAVAAFLTITNIIYIAVGKNSFGNQAKQHALFILLMCQMLTDFISLSFLTYSFGSIETPFSTLFMAHIILSTLFFHRVVSSAIAGAAWFFASLPLVLEWSGVVPVSSIFDGQLKSDVVLNFRMTVGFVLGTGAVFFVCWYLTSVITRSLKLREIQLESAVRMMTRMAEEKARTTLRATHELKAPFAAIKSYVYVLRDGYCGPIPDKAMQVVGKIGDRCDHLMNKITDIIHLGNLQAMVVPETEMAVTDLVPILEEAVREGALLGEPRRIKVTGVMEKGLSVFILGSTAHLKSLFLNLVRNAVSYTKDNEGRVDVILKVDDGRAVVTVADNGIGIPDSDLSNIFDEHFRSKNAVAHNASGTGLGLSIATEVARLHGTSIQVESEVGKGSKFSISFEMKDSKLERGNHG